MNNVRLQRILISVSLVTQVFGFATLGSLMALRGGSDSGARIGGLLAVLTGTMFLVAAIAYWRTCHRQTGQHLGVTGILAAGEGTKHFGYPVAGLLARNTRPFLSTDPTLTWSSTIRPNRRTWDLMGW